MADGRLLSPHASRHSNMHVNGFVHIIESPGPDDLLDGPTEGRALTEALTLAEIPYCYSLVSDLATFSQALGPRLVKACQSLNQLPILHLSMHGSSDGIQLTNGHFIRWADLRTMLQPVATEMNGRLLICMSSCFGLEGCRMAMHEGPEPTFWAIVGHAGEAHWADAAVAYISFYHLFFKGKPIDACVLGMRVASGDGGFLSMPGADMKRSWQEQLPEIRHEALLWALGGRCDLPRPAPDASDAGQPVHGPGCKIGNGDAGTP